MLQLVKEMGGRSVVFNGNEYALSRGEYGVASTDLRLVQVFSDLDNPKQVAKGWNERREEIASEPAASDLVPPDLAPLLEDLDPFPHLHYIGDGYEQHQETHQRFRELLRGEAAKLG